MEIKEQLGYLTALLEELKDDVKSHRSESIEWRDATQITLSKLQKEMDMYATIVKTLKFILACSIAVLTFKLGSVAELWHIFKAS